MFRGVPPERHGITTNTWVPQVRPVPSITDVLRRARKRTAALYNWEQLRDLSDPGSLDFCCFIRNCDSPAGDLEIAARAVDWLGRGETDFAFVYFGYTDIAGHNHGWMSPPYLEAISNVDRAIGEVAGTVDDGRTAMIVTSDHGGHDRTHGTEMPEDMTIPWLLCCPGVTPGEIAGEVSDRRQRPDDRGPARGRSGPRLGRPAGPHFLMCSLICSRYHASPWRSFL